MNSKDWEESIIHTVEKISQLKKMLATRWHATKTQGFLLKFRPHLGVVKQMTVHKVLLTTDEESGREAIYVDGNLSFEDCTVYAIDVATATKGMQVEIEHKTVCLEDQIFPKDASELKFIEA